MNKYLTDLADLYQRIGQDDIQNLLSEEDYIRFADALSTVQNTQPKGPWRYSYQNPNYGVLLLKENREEKRMVFLDIISATTKKAAITGEEIADALNLVEALKSHSDSVFSWAMDFVRDANNNKGLAPLRVAGDSTLEVCKAFLQLKLENNELKEQIKNQSIGNKT